MPAALDAKEKAAIVDRLFVVFQDHGYEGASLADLSRATGLGKSSLYHHFPQGKEQMAEAVLEQGKAFIQSAVAEVARSPEPLKVRIRKIIAALDRLYAGGRNACVLGRLAVSEIGPSSCSRKRYVTGSIAPFRRGLDRSRAGFSHSVCGEWRLHTIRTHYDVPPGYGERKGLTGDLLSHN
jgi:AcrR family transcriptional regulator